MRLVSGSLMETMGVPLTMRIRFADLPENRRPRSEAAEFSKAWQQDLSGEDFRDVV